MFASDYRRMAREALRGAWKPALRVMLLAQAVFLYFGLDVIYTSFFARPNYFQINGQTAWLTGYYGYTPVGLGWLLLALLFLIELAAPMVTVGQYRAMAGLHRGESPAARQLFPWGLFWKALAMNLLRGLLVFLWSLLFIVPGLIALFRYAMADYLLAEEPELGPVAALRESRERMQGRKGALFGLQFSFFGWYMLTVLAGMVISALLMNAPSAPAGLIYSAVMCLISTPLNAYMLCAEAAFFRDAREGARSRWAQEAPTAYPAALGERAASAASGEEPAPAYAAPEANEAAARELFLQNGCSRARLREAGLLEEYEALHPSPGSEAIWRRDYGDALMNRFDRDPAALDALLPLCAEYADEWLANRVFQRIDRHIRQESLPEAEVLNMVGRALAVLTSGAFAGNPGFLARRLEQVSDMADRLEVRLREKQPEGGWQEALARVRALCRED